MHAWDECALLGPPTHIHTNTHYHGHSPHIITVTPLPHKWQYLLAAVAVQRRTMLRGAGRVVGAVTHGQSA